MMSPSPGLSSPMLGRRALAGGSDSPLRALSCEPDDYMEERNKVIGELTSRMKRLPRGFDKNRRGDFDDSTSCRSSACASPLPTFEVLDDNFNSTNSSSSNYGDYDDSERRSRSSNNNNSNKIVPVKATEITTSASLTPQRTASASINLTPSPKPGRARARSKSPAMHSRLHTTSHSSRPSPATSTTSLNLSRQNSSNSSRSGGAVGGSTSNLTSTRIRSSSKPRATPGAGGAGLGARPVTQRSISVQSAARSNGGSSSAAPARKPLSTRTPNTNGSRHGGSMGNSLNAPPHGINRSISADPQLSDPAILAKIGNRATKVVQKSIGKCGTCNKAIQEDGCTAFGKVYHKACFKCHVCRQKITGKFFEKDGKPYCAKDFAKAVDDCTVCGLPIKGDAVESNNKSFHPECMKCYVCGDSLGRLGPFFTFQDKPICERDYKQVAEKCSQCGEAPSGTYYTLNDQLFCEGCHRSQCERCPRCDDEVTGKVVRISGAAYHPDCFSCVVCKKNMINVPFISDDKQQIYCSDDYNKKKAPRCSFCKKPIVPKDGQKTAPRLRALNRDFHPNCFQCEDCGMVLDSRQKGRECYPFKNHVYCYKCNRKKLSSSESESDDDDE